MKVFYALGSELHPHPLLGREGMLPDMIEREDRLGRKPGSNRADHQARAQELRQEFSALMQNQLAHGTLEPLKVVKSLTGWLIADGRNRWAGHMEITATSHGDEEMDRLAERWQAKGLPCVEVSEEEVPSIILSAITRRHMSKQARALMAVKAFPAVAEAAPKGGDRRSKGNHYPLITQESLALQVGVSAETMKDACQFWRNIALNPKTREERMNQVFAGMSFERVQQGEKGAQTTAGKSRNPDKVWTLMTRNANSIKLHWNDYKTLEPDKQISILEHLTEAFETAPPEVKTALITALEKNDQ